jgi:hypothetical protein
VSGVCILCPDCLPHEQEVEPGLYSAAFRCDGGQQERKLEVTMTRHDWTNDIPLQMIAYTRQQDHVPSVLDKRKELAYYADEVSRSVTVHLQLHSC